MVTLAMAAVLAAVAVPSFSHMIASHRLTTTTNSLIGKLNGARSMAVKRNAPVQLCGSKNNGDDTLGTKCATPGALYALDKDNNGVKLRSAVQPGHGIHYYGNTIRPIRFTPNGLARTPADGNLAHDTLIAIIRVDGLDANNCRAIKISAGASIKVEKATCGGGA